MRFKFDFQNRGRGLYRARNSALLGVCRGLAEYFDFSVPWTRAIAVAAFVFTGFWPVGITYLILALVMKPAPALPPADDGEAEFYNSYTSSRAMALGRLKRTYDSLERRLRRLEDHVTSSHYSWERKVKG